MSIDLTPIVSPILAVVGTAIAGLLAVYVPRGLALIEARTGVQLTDQQRAQVLGAVQTAAGVLETRLDQGVLQVAHIDIANQAVRDQAIRAIDAVPNAAAALGMTVEGVSRMIVGMTDTAKHGATTAVTQATAPDEITTTTTATGAAP